MKNAEVEKELKDYHELAKAQTKKIRELKAEIERLNEIRNIMRDDCAKTEAGLLKQIEYLRSENAKFSKLVVAIADLYDAWLYGYLSESTSICLNKVFEEWKAL